MIVAGVMSGTSADGIDVAMVEVSHAARTRLKLLDNASFPYPAKVRRMVLDLMNADRASVADLARLNFLLGGFYAVAVFFTQKNFRHKPVLIGFLGEYI